MLTIWNLCTQEILYQSYREQELLEESFYRKFLRLMNFLPNCKKLSVPAVMRSQSMQNCFECHFNF